MSPYEILGVNESASDAEIEQEYNKLVNYYTENKSRNSAYDPISDEKIAQLNDAYRRIRELRDTRGNVGEPSQFVDIRRLINNNRTNEADELLEGVPPNSRDAEWYFLKASIQHSKGWLEDAYENFVRAAQLNPQNAEYRAALNQLQWQRQTGRATTSRMNPEQMPAYNCGICDICTSMCCANMCCNCMGGGC